MIIMVVVHYGHMQSASLSRAPNPESDTVKQLFQKAS